VRYLPANSADNGEECFSAIEKLVTEADAFEKLHPEIIAYEGIYFFPHDLWLYGGMTLLFMLLAIAGFRYTQNSLVKRVGKVTLLMSALFFFITSVFPHLYYDHVFNFDPLAVLIRNFVIPENTFACYSTFSPEWHIQWSQTSVEGLSAYGIMAGLLLTSFYEFTLSKVLWPVWKVIHAYLSRVK
jgi:hypothetical protein